MDDIILTWEITPLEKRKRIRKFILKVWLAVIGLIIFSSFWNISGFYSWALRQGIKSAFFEVIYITIAAAIFIWLFFFLNELTPYKLRTYRLDNRGIEISKGKKKKYFSWNEFECFYPYRFYRSYPNYPGELFRRRILKLEQQIRGQIFYLKKKSTGPFAKLFKVFVVVYSEPDNIKAVEEFLSKHLPKKKRTLSIDLGLIFYQFK